MAHNLDSMFLKPSGKHHCVCLLKAMYKEVLLIKQITKNVAGRVERQMKNKECCEVKCKTGHSQLQIRQKDLVYCK
jgi:hypothetical protein